MGWWSKKQADEATKVSHGVEALGMPCLYRFFKLPCSYCEQARKAWDPNNRKAYDELKARQVPFALALLKADDIEELEHVNRKLIVINVPIKQCVQEIANRLKIGEWDTDPTSLEDGFVIRMLKQRGEYTEYIIGKGPKASIDREKVIGLYTNLEIPNPIYDPVLFLDWIYNKHPDLVVASWADIPFNKEVSLRFIPWPIKTKEGYVPEPEVNPDAAPFKVLRFHWQPILPEFEELKEASFDVTRVQKRDDLGSDSDVDDDDIPF